MVRKIQLVVALLVATLLVGAATTHAIEEDASRDPVLRSTRGSSEARESRASERKEKTQAKRAGVQEAQEERKARLQEKIAELKSERTEKLEGKRLELCEKREKNINILLGTSVTKSQDKMAVFQKIKERAIEFYDKKGLSNDRYAAALQNANDEEAAALAAIAIMSNETFSCDSADGERPGQVIKTIVQARGDAMQSYRTAVKNLLHVVKQSFQEAKAVEPSIEGES